MLKKIQISIIILLFLMIPIYVNASEKDTGEYTPEYQKYLELSDEEREKWEVIPRKYKDSVYDYLNEIFTNEEQNIVKAAELPNKYDLRDKIYMQVENQGSYGLCWDFASMKSLETNLALKERKIL